MVESSMKIQVDIGDDRYTGSEPYSNWERSQRPAAKDQTIGFFGVASENHLPFRRPSVVWDMIYLSDDGFGVAVNHEKSQNLTIDGGSFLANVFITTNHARHWKENPMRLGLGSRIRAMTSWPVELFHSLTVTQNQTILLAWEDPWIMDRARTHVIISHDRGLRWHYHRLNECYPCLCTTPDGQIMCFSEKTRHYSRDEGNQWHADAISVDVDNGSPGIGYSHIQNATFVSEQHGFALLAKYNRNVSTASPEAIILISTRDNGNAWHCVAEFAYPSTSAWRDPRQIWSLAVI